MKICSLKRNYNQIFKKTTPNLKQLTVKRNLLFYSDVKESSAKLAVPSDSQNRNLWITNISQTTRATELKQALSEHGKVIGAKVVINARYPGACCYGYVKMETVADADNCIAKLNGTELNGQIIRIEKVSIHHLNKKYPEDQSFNTISF